MSPGPTDRDARIARIVESIDMGTYEVQDILVADAVLERWRRFDVLEPSSVLEPARSDQIGSEDAASSDSSSR